MIKNRINTVLSGFSPIKVRMDYIECKNTEVEPDGTHSHDECEIYINLSGDLAFEVEGLVYPIFPGSVIITAPGEKHRCIYRSHALHKHYCIWFSAEGNEELFPAFFKRSFGERNLLNFSKESFASLMRAADRLMQADGEVKALSAFFSLADKITDNSLGEQTVAEALPEDVAIAVTYINENISEKITVADLADLTNVNITTLERHFMGVFRITPHEYIKKQRMNLAAEQLLLDKTVTEVCFLCGFSDLSKFISRFKEQFGKTPKQYQKSEKHK